MREHDNTLTSQSTSHITSPEATNHENHIPATSKARALLLLRGAHAALRHPVR